MLMRWPVLSCLVFLPGSVIAADTTVEPPTRTFRFTYEATATGFEPKQAVRIWVPVPSSSSDQKVELVEQNLPGPSKLGTEPRFGNRILYVEAHADAAGTVPIKLVYRATRRELRSGAGQPRRAQSELSL